MSTTTIFWLGPIGLALVVVAWLSYFLLLRNAWIRATALPNIVVMILGTALGIYAATQAGQQSATWMAAGDVLLTLLFFALLFVWFRLPAPQSTAHTDGLAPDVTLPNQDGEPVALSALRGRGPVLLVFYRGHW